MFSTSDLLLLAHLLGLSLAVGAATAKLILLLKTRKDLAFVHVYTKVSKPVTRLIILGIAVLTLSGIGWLLLGYPLTDKLIIKLALVLLIWVMGPIIDNAIEPKFNKLVTEIGGANTQEFLRIQKRYLVAESVATGMFYLIIIIWVLF